MSLLVPRVRRDLKAFKAPKVPSAIQVLRTSKSPRLAHRGSVTILRTWRVGAGPAVLVLGQARARALLRLATCRTRPRDGSRRDRNSRLWATARGTLTHSNLALVVTQVPQVLRLPRALLDMAVSRQTKPQATKGPHRSRLRLGLLPTRNP